MVGPVASDKLAVLVTLLHCPDTTTVKFVASVAATEAMVKVLLFDPVTFVPFRLHWKVNGPVPEGVVVNVTVEPKHTLVSAVGPDEVTFVATVKFAQDV